jgi:rubrerythrin
MVVPFLDEEESKEIFSLYDKCITFAKENRVKNNASLDDIFEPVRKAYEKMTGFENMHQNAIWHHKLSLLGPDCPSCGKPLRTKRAKLCPECGWHKDS